MTGPSRRPEAVYAEVVLAVALASLAVAAKPPDPKQFLRVDARHKIVDVTLIAGYDGSNNGFNFDGYSRELMWTVPVGWRVRVTCSNRGALRHSCAVVKGPASTKPSFEGGDNAASPAGPRAREDRALHVPSLEDRRLPLRLSRPRPRGGPDVRRTQGRRQG